MKIEDLIPAALGIISLVVLVGVGAVVLAELDEPAFEEYDITNETQTPSDSLPSNLTVSAESNSSFEQVETSSETLYLDEGANDSNLQTLSEGNDYKSFYDQGIFELQSGSTTLSSYNSSTDRIRVDYTYEESGTANSILDSGKSALDTISDFFVVIIVIVIAAVIFGLLKGLRMMGGRKTV